MISRLLAIYVSFAAVITATVGAAQAEQDAILATMIDTHVIPAFTELDRSAQTLAAVARQDCSPSSSPLRKAYHDAYDAWLGAAHLRFGPMEEVDFAFALSFWPDPRGKTAKALRRLIADQDPIAGSPDFAKVSVAAKGFPALERLLFDDALAADPAYQCTLTRAVASEIARTSAALLADWAGPASKIFKSAGEVGNDLFRKRDDARRKLYTSLMTSLGFDADARVGRPLGTFERPRPKRAEAWRSGRPLRNLRLSIEAQRAFAAVFAQAGEDSTAAQVNAAYLRVLNHIDEIDNPQLDGSISPSAWLKMDILKQDIIAIQVTIDGTLGRDLGLFVGFNSQDGD